MVIPKYTSTQLLFFTETSQTLFGGTWNGQYYLNGSKVTKFCKKYFTVSTTKVTLGVKGKIIRTSNKINSRSG